MYQVTYRGHAEPQLLERLKHAKARYSDAEFSELAGLFAIVVEALSQKPYDFLGSVFMQLELGDGYKGQYFTPSHVADLMAKVTLQNCHDILAQKGFITISEPTCGSGVMVIGCVNTLIEMGFNPQQCLWAHCQDIDFTAAMMCYIQLSLLHIPARITIGNTLTDKTQFELYTLAHLMGNWFNKLEQKTMPSGIIDAVTVNATEAETVINVTPSLPLLADIGEDEVIFY